MYYMSIMYYSKLKASDLFGVANLSKEASEQ